MYILASCTIGIKWLHVMHLKWGGGFGYTRRRNPNVGIGKRVFFFLIHDLLHQVQYMTQPSATKCRCGYDAVISEVKKPGQNRGRWYWRVSNIVRFLKSIPVLN